MKIQKYKKKFHNHLYNLTVSGFIKSVYYFLILVQIESTRIGMEIISNYREALPSAAVS